MYNLKKFKQFINENLNNNIWYHGSNNEFSEFKLINNKGYREFDLPVWYFTKNLKYAKTYGKFLYKVKLYINNIFNTLNKKHFNLFVEYLQNNGKTDIEINRILDEQFFRELPYWTCEDVYYCAISNGFDSVLIAEELEKHVESIAVFDKNNIEIIK